MKVGLITKWKPVNFDGEELEMDEGDYVCDTWEELEQALSDYIREATPARVMGHRMVELSLKFKEI